MKEFLAGKGGTVATLIGVLAAMWLTAIVGRHLPADVQGMILAGEGTLGAVALSLMNSLRSPSPTTSSTTTTTKTSAPTPEEETK